MKTDSLLHRPAARFVLASPLLLLVPLVAMRFTDEVVWTAVDFVVAGVLLTGTGVLYLAATRRAAGPLHRAAAGLALGAALALVWANLAVGVVGEPGGAVNAMFFGVVLLGGIGALLARLRPAGMAWALFAMALAQAVAAGATLALGLAPPASPLAEVLLVNGGFVALFAAAGALFRRASRSELPAGTGPRK